MDTHSHAFYSPHEPQKKSICFIHLRSIENVIVFVVARYSTKGLQNVSFFFTQKEQIASLGPESCRCGFRLACEHIKGGEGSGKQVCGMRIHPPHFIWRLLLPEASKVLFSKAAFSGSKCFWLNVKKKKKVAFQLHFPYKWDFPM